MGNQNEMDIDLDIIEFLYFLKKKIWIIGASIAVCAILGFVVSQFFIPPRYTASTRMYVLSRTNDTSIEYTDFQVSSQVLNDYKVLITGRNVTEEVIQHLSLDMVPEELTKKIKVTAPSDTRVLQVDVTDTDPQRAADIANCVRKISSEQITSIMDADSVKLIYEANIPDQPSSPHVPLWTLLAAAFGLILCLGVYIVIFIIDDTIRTEEDIEHYLRLSMLGAIPESSQLGAKRNTGKKSIRRMKKR